VRPRAIVLHVHAQIEDQGFLAELIRRLELSLAPPIVARTTDFDLGPLRAAGYPLDGQALVDAVVRAIDWGASGDTVQVLLIKDDLRVPPARYNFAVSHGSATSRSASSSSLWRDSRGAGPGAGLTWPPGTRRNVSPNWS
jgi:hypothetical protein